MQEESGRMRLLDEAEFKVRQADPMLNPKTIKEGMYFRIKHTYFKITTIQAAGIFATGVSRREYFDNRNKD